MHFAPTIRKALDSLEAPEDSFDTLSSKEKIWSRIKRTADAKDLIARELGKSMGEYISPATDFVANTTVGTILGRPEISIYNEFSTKFGLEFVRHYWVPFSYPSRVWQEIEKGEGPTLLSEIGSRLWRFNRLQQIAKKTNALTQSATVDDLVDRSFVDNFLRGYLGASDFLKSDATADWWFKKETFALRYYLIGILSFPESFLGLLKNDDIHYSKELKKIFDIETDLQKIWESLLPADHEIHATKLLQQPFEDALGAFDVVSEASEPSAFINYSATIG